MKVAIEIVRARRDRLADLLRVHRYLPVTELKTILRISEATLRRDLAALAKENKVTRTYGGALGDFDVTFASFRERAGRNRAAKQRIARAAYGLLRTGATCFFDAGTTLHALAALLSQRPMGAVTVVTNNIPVAETLGGIPDVEVQLPAGRFLSRQSVVLGGPANRSLRFWNFDLAFFGAEGFDGNGIWNTNADVVAFQRAVMARACQSYFLLDRSKLGRPTRDRVAAWDEPVRLITDAPAGALERHGIRLSRDKLVPA